MKIIDLTVKLNENTPVYPGDATPKITKAGVLASDGYCDHLISVGTHVGTHIDAPAHMVEGGDTLDEIDVSRFVGRGKYIKVENKVFDLDAVKNAHLQESDIVIFHTGLSDLYGKSKDYFESYPKMPQEIAEYLIEKKISMVCLDTCSPDHEEFTIHRLLLDSGILIAENLTNLGGLNGQEFTVYALPLNLEIDGSPARIIAQIEEA